MNSDPTIGDVINAIEKLKRIASFGNEFIKLVSSMANCGVDLSKINPYNFNDLLRMALSLSKSDEITEIDIEALRDAYEDIINIRMSEIRGMCIAIRRFLVSYSEVNSVLSSLFSRAKVGSDELEIIRGLFGISARKEEKEEYEFEDVEQLTPEEVESLKKVIKRKS